MAVSVEQYIEQQPLPQKKLLKKLRSLLLATLDDQEERMEWGVAVFGQGKFYLAALKGRVHVGFAITGLSKEEVKLFEGSGKTMRHIKIFSPEDIREKRLTELIKMVDEKAVFAECKV